MSTFSTASTTRRESSIRGSPGSRTPFTYTYDANSNVTNLAYPNGDSAAMTYNHADQMTQKTDVANSVTILSLGYTPDSIGLTTAEATCGA